jgi:hypothetical protein
VAIKNTKNTTLGKDPTRNVGHRARPDFDGIEMVVALVDQHFRFGASVPGQRRLALDGKLASGM